MEHVREAFGQDGTPVRYVGVGLLGEVLQLVAAGEVNGVIGQHMVIDHVDDGAGVEAVGFFEDDPGVAGKGVRIGEIVDRPVQRNSLLNAFRVVVSFLSLDKIADQVAYRYFGYPK